MAIVSQSKHHPTDPNTIFFPLCSGPDSARYKSTCQSLSTGVALLAIIGLFTWLSALLNRSSNSCFGSLFKKHYDKGEGGMSGGEYIILCFMITQVHY